MLPAPSSGFVQPQLGASSIKWPLGQDQGQWNSLIAAMGGSPLSAQPTSYVPGAPNIQRGQDPSLPQQPSGPSDTTRNLMAALQAASVGRQGVNLVNQFAQNPDLATGSALGGAGLGAAGAGAQFSQGQYGPGTLSLLNALSQGSRGAAGLGLVPQAAGSIGGALGGAAGIAGGAYGLSQGDPHGGAGIVSGTGQAASSLGSLLGYQAPAFGASGLGTTAAGEGTALLASGTEMSAGTVLGALGEALGPLGIVLGLGVLGDVGISALQDKWKAGIPELGQAAKNPVSTKSFMTGQAFSDWMQQQAGSLGAGQLFSLAGMNQITPGGEAQFRHTTAGTINDPAYQQLLQGAMSGDPQALGDFLQGIEIYTGETGATHVNNGATDSYRRSLLNQMPQALQQQVLAAHPDLFPDQVPSLADQSSLLAALQAQKAMGSQLAPYLDPVNTERYNQLFGHEHASPLFQDPAAYTGMRSLIDQIRSDQIPYQQLYQDPYYAQFEQYTHPSSSQE